MPITAGHESILSANSEAKKILDPPFMINIFDGRLIPHVKNTGADPAYRPYRGDPKASLEDRMRYVQANLAARRVINSAVDDVEKEPVDVGKMEKAELIAFAFDEYGLPLDPGMDIRTMRKRVVEIAAKVPPTPTKADLPATPGDDMSE